MVSTETHTMSWFSESYSQIKKKKDKKSDYWLVGPVHLVGVIISTIEITIPLFDQMGGNFETASISDDGIEILQRYETTEEAELNHEKYVKLHSGLIT